MPSARARQFLEAIGANTARYRHLRNMTQEKLAVEAGIDLTFLQRIERGRTNLGMVVLVALADALGVQPRELLRLAKLRPARRGRPPIKRRAGISSRS
jgi:transcriptional regulator with XRE-family HTH domain